MDVPLQPNECDCGIYLLHYVELIFQNTSHYLGNDIPDVSQWFVSKDVNQKRVEIASESRLKTISNN